MRRPGVLPLDGSDEGSVIAALALGSIAPPYPVCFDDREEDEPGAAAPAAGFRDNPVRWPRRGPDPGLRGDQ
jgi:hypothetical protein